jgi:hypothetical protein
MSLRLGFKVGFREGFFLGATLPMLGDQLFALDVVEGFEFVVHVCIIPCGKGVARGISRFSAVVSACATRVYVWGPAR